MKDTLRSIAVSAAVIAIAACIAFATGSYFDNQTRTARATECVRAGGSFVRDNDTALCILPGSGNEAAPVIRDFLDRGKKAG